MEFNFKRYYERFRESNEFDEMMKLPPDFDSEKWTMQDLGKYIFTSTVKWAKEHPYIPEIDWNKVRTGTKVEVKHSYGREWMPRIFFVYNENTTNKFWVYDNPTGLSSTGYPYCRLVEDNPEYHKD